MDQISYFKDLFESIPKYKKLVVLIFLIKNDLDWLQEYGFLINDINRLCIEFKSILMEQNEDYFHYIENEEDSNKGLWISKWNNILLKRFKMLHMKNR